MAEKKSAFGFGFIPEETKQHFLVNIPREKNQPIIIYERFEWQDDQKTQSINQNIDKIKAKITKYKWNLIEEALKNEFNSRLKQMRVVVGRWKQGQTPVERQLGKELLLLVWAIEDCDPSVIPVAVRNWLGLSPEERWWLYTMTNASSGGLDEKRGWRKAIKYALAENPIEEINHQRDLFDFLLDNKTK